MEGRGFKFFWKWGAAPPRKNRDFRVELGETTHPVQKNRPVKKSPRARPGGDGQLGV